MPEPLTITISQNAAQHVRSFTQKAEDDPISLRVGVKGGGCSGLTYDLSVDSDVRDDDKIIEPNSCVIKNYIKYNKTLFTKM